MGALAVLQQGVGWAARPNTALIAPPPSPRPPPSAPTGLEGQRHLSGRARAHANRNDDG